MAIQVVILAAGRGKRMQSSLPKVLHLLAGQPLLGHVLRAAQAIASDVPPVVVIGHEGEQVAKHFAKSTARFVEQKEQLGTGHAVMQTLNQISDNDQVLILCGDVPLITVETLKRLIAATPRESLGLLTATLEKPTGYGRIKRNERGHIVGIVEEKDATDAERNIHEINPGVYLAEAVFLKRCLPELSNANAQKEYYLTDIIERAVKEKMAICSVQPNRHEEILGVNDRVQLAALERHYQRHLAETWMRQGVTFIDPSRFDVRGEVHIGKEVVIDVNVILEGKVVIGDYCVIGPNTLLRDVTLGERVEVKANSVVDGATIGSDSVIGPFARLRPGTVLASNVHIGNFVEVKNSVVDVDSKINHLTYVGDSQVGKKVNIGAGTITCNYDGANKHKTTIGDHVHIGSDTLLVAPVTVGNGATIAAGSILTKDAPPNALTLTHKLQQRSVENWQRPEKVKLEERS